MILFHFGFFLVFFDTQLHSIWFSIWQNRNRKITNSAPRAYDCQNYIDFSMCVCNSFAFGPIINADTFLFFNEMCCFFSPFNFFFNSFSFIFSSNIIVPRNCDNCQHQHVFHPVSFFSSQFMPTVGVMCACVWGWWLCILFVCCEFNPPKSLKFQNLLKIKQQNKTISKHAEEREREDKCICMDIKYRCLVISMNKRRERWRPAFQLYQNLPLSLYVVHPHFCKQQRNNLTCHTTPCSTEQIYSMIYALWRFL